MSGLPNKRSFKVLISLIFFSVLLSFINNSIFLNSTVHYTNTLTSVKDKFSLVIPSSSQFLEETLPNSYKTEKVVIGLVVCRSSKAKGNSYYRQTLTLIKSLLISCKLYNISAIEIHLFLEHIKDEEYFRNEIKENLHFPLNETQPTIQLSLQVHPAVKAVPEKYRAHMIYHKRFRCGYVRFFYPNSLPNVDSIIHLDSDIIVTGNIARHWQLLKEMDDTQLIAVGYNRQPENNKFRSLDYSIFKNAPFVPPKGVNSGVLVMNLTRMRKFGLVNKLERLYDDYSKITELHDQKVLNILLYYNPGFLKILPCELHFLPTECEVGFFCQSAYRDPDGLHLIHGTAWKFTRGYYFHPIYNYYSKFKLSNPQSNLTRDLMLPIQKAYTKSGNKCFGVLDKVLFKRFLSNSSTF